MGFLRMGDDGTTTLNILNPDNDGVISEKERVITLGQKVGKLKRGLFSDSCECVSSFHLYYVQRCKRRYCVNPLVIFLHLKYIFVLD